MRSSAHRPPEPIARLHQRIEIEREDSDASLFHALLYAGEALLKTVVLGFVAAIENHEQQYRQAHRLVRADGLGDWIEVLNEATQGPASASLGREARIEQKAATQRVGQDDNAWQFAAVESVHSLLVALDPDCEPLAGRVAGQSWFTLFVQLRNKTRGHGAPTGSFYGDGCQTLQASFEHWIENFGLFKRPWAYLHQNLSGRYRVTPLSADTHEFQYLKSGSPPSMPDGVYVYLDRPVRLAGLESTVDAVDFYYWNGGFTNSSHELISYATGDTIKRDSSSYLKPASGLPASETRATKLDVVGNCYTNLPPLQSGYVSREELEAALNAELFNEHHLAVTLIGRGGIGKTSLALATLQRLRALDRYAAILWFSARDIDLLPQGPRQVSPDVRSERDMAKQLVRLAEPTAAHERDFDELAFFADALGNGLRLFDDPVGPTLFVFDNFETVRRAVDVYNWIDNNIRMPNKALLTTRFRDFRGDYPVEVGGMTRTECDVLAHATAAKFGIEPWLSEQILQELYEESEGHPYVVKVLVGEAAKRGQPGNVKRIVAAREDILVALFERTYATLSPAAQRVFLTLASWRSSVPQLALEAVLLRPDNERMDVSAAVEELEKSSLIDVSISPADDERFLSVPLVGAVFGKQKLTVSSYKSAIESDVALLRSFGAGQPGDAATGVAPRITRFFRDVARLVSESPDKLEAYIPMLEMLARQQSPAWLLLSELYEDQGNRYLPSAIEATRRFLEKEPGRPEGWKRLAELSRRNDDYLGEIQARVEGATLPDAPLSAASNAAHRLNGMLGRQELTLDLAEKEILAKRLLGLLEARRGEVDASDCSRAAWLSISIKDFENARRWTDLGLELDPSNPYCQKLDSRLG